MRTRWNSGRASACRGTAAAFRLAATPLTCVAAGEPDFAVDLAPEGEPVAALKPSGDPLEAALPGSSGQEGGDGGHHARYPLGRALAQHDIDIAPHRGFALVQVPERPQRHQIGTGHSRT